MSNNPSGIELVDFNASEVIVVSDFRLRDADLL
jgi:hypothetical protein